MIAQCYLVKHNILKLIINYKLDELKKYTKVKNINDETKNKLNQLSG